LSSVYQYKRDPLSHLLMGVASWRNHYQKGVTKQIISCGADSGAIHMH